jgi:hypothetical protein
MSEAILRAHHDGLRYRAARTTMHLRAMEAKGKIFEAQDALSAMWSLYVEERERGGPIAKIDRFLRAAEKRLARVRHELEQLDNLVNAEKWREAIAGEGPPP